MGGTYIKYKINPDLLVILSGLILGSAILLLTSGKLFGSIPFALVFFLGYAYIYFHFPKTVLLIFSIFLLFQELIANNISLRTTNNALVGGFKSLDEIIILYSFLILLIKKRFILSRTPVDYPILGFLVVGLLSSLTSHVPVHVASLGAFLMIKGFLVFYLYSHMEYQESDLKRYVKWVGSVAFVFLFMGVVDLIVAATFRNFTGNAPHIDYRFDIPSVQSLFVHPGVFGWFMAYTAMFSIAFYLVFKKRYYLIYGLLFSLGSFISMRRKSLGGILVGIGGGLFNMPSTQRLRTGVPVIIAISLASIILLPKLTGLFGNMMETYVYVKDPMENARGALYMTSGRIAMDYFPFGAGFGQYGGWISRKYYSPVYYKYGLSNIYGMSKNKTNFMNDTYWPHILGELGLVGFLCYLSAILSLLYMNWRASKLLLIPIERAFALGSVMVFLEAIVESMAQPVFEAPPHMFFVFAAAGITFSLYRKEKLKALVGYPQK